MKLLFYFLTTVLLISCSQDTKTTDSVDASRLSLLLIETEAAYESGLLIVQAQGNGHAILAQGHIDKLDDIDAEVKAMYSKKSNLSSTVASVTSKFSPEFSEAGLVATAYYLKLAMSADLSNSQVRVDMTKGISDLINAKVIIPTVYKTVLQESFSNRAIVDSKVSDEGLDFLRDLASKKEIYKQLDQASRTGNFSSTETHGDGYVSDEATSIGDRITQIHTKVWLEAAIEAEKILSAQ